MSTTWVVTTAAERIDLDAEGSGQTTFTVTNQGGTADRAVFEAVAGAGAEPGWFSVDEPQRRVEAAGSASFLVRTTVPAGTAHGTYELRGRVYSADSAPEETSVLSGRIVFDVAAPPAPKKRTIPWWVYVVAAALVVIVIVTVTLVLTLGGGDTPPAAGPSATPVSVEPTPNGTATVPSVTGKSEGDARAALTRAGLVVGAVKHRFDTAQVDKVLEQTRQADTIVNRGSTVDLVVGATLSAPAAATAPGTTLGAGQPITWTQPEKWVTSWQVTVSIYLCVPPSSCDTVPVIRTLVDKPSYVPPVRVPLKGPAGSVVTRGGAWGVIAFDDFGTPGPALPDVGVDYPITP
jgi:hypothetical protein